MPRMGPKMVWCGGVGGWGSGTRSLGVAPAPVELLRRLEQALLYSTISLFYNLKRGLFYLAVTETPEEHISVTKPTLLHSPD